jgi:hypothetical protein
MSFLSASKSAALGEQGNPAPSAQAIINEGDDDGDGVYFIQNVGAVFCDMTTDGGGWMHAGTISDNGSINLGGDGGGTESQHPWAYGIHHDSNDNQTLNDNSIGIWGDSSSLSGDNDPQSFESDFKNGALWSQNSFSQILMKDSGNSLRNLWFTQPGEVDSNFSSSLQEFFSEGGHSGDVWTIDDGAPDNRNEFGPVTTYQVTDFNVSDNVFGSGYGDVHFFYGEPQRREAGNNDRSVITRGRINSQSVSATQGIGVSRIGDGNDKWRDIDPQFRDSPGNISNTYNYTLWIR